MPLDHPIILHTLLFSDVDAAIKAIPKQGEQQVEASLAALDAKKVCGIVDPVSI